MCDPRLSFQDAYGVYLDMFGPALRAAFGVEPAIVSTGGNCMAIELRLEGGITAWITDAGDPLSPWPWRIDDPANASESFGWGTLIMRDGEPDNIGGSIDYDAPDTPDAVVKSVRDALDDARRDGVNIYGPAGLTGDRINRGLDT